MVATKGHALPLWIKVVSLTRRYRVIAYLMATERRSTIKQMRCCCTSTHTEWLAGLPPRLYLLLLLRLVQLAVISHICDIIAVVNICLLIALLFLLFHVTKTFVCQWLLNIDTSCILVISSSDWLSTERDDVVFKAILNNRCGIIIRQRSRWVEGKLLWIADLVVTTDGGWLVVLMLRQVVVIEPLRARLRTAATTVRRSAAGSFNFLSCLLPAWSLH